MRPATLRMVVPAATGTGTGPSRSTTRTVSVCVRRPPVTATSPVATSAPITPLSSATGHGRLSLPGRRRRRARPGRGLDNSSDGCRHRRSSGGSGGVTGSSSPRPSSSSTAFEDNDGPWSVVVALSHGRTFPFTICSVRPPDVGHDWLALTGAPLPVAAAAEWVVRPGCGGVVVFTGTVRDHAEGRTGVTGLSYEAYEEQVGPAPAALAAEARSRWPMLGRVVLLHRTGPLAIGEASVVAAVSTPHRAEAF